LCKTIKSLAKLQQKTEEELENLSLLFWIGLLKENYSDAKLDKNNITFT
jgi:hypothetical protein